MRLYIDLNGIRKRVLKTPVPAIPNTHDLIFRFKKKKKTKEKITKAKQLMDLFLETWADVDREGASWDWGEWLDIKKKHWFAVFKLFSVTSHSLNTRMSESGRKVCAHPAEYLHNYARPHREQLCHYLTLREIRNILWSVRKNICRQMEDR